MPTFTQIGSTVTVGAGGAASIDFTTIPTTYTDLVILASLRGNITSNEASLEFNGLSTNLSDRVIYNSGGTAGSNTDTRIRLFATRDASPTNWSNTLIYIPNYGSTSANKSVSIDQVNEENNSNTISTLSVGIWASTAAITSIKLKSLSAFAQHSTAYLYGVSNV